MYQEVGGPERMIDKLVVPEDLDLEVMVLYAFMNDYPSRHAPDQIYGCQYDMVVMDRVLDALKVRNVAAGQLLYLEPPRPQELDHVLAGPILARRLGDLGGVFSSQDPQGCCAATADGLSDAGKEMRDELPRTEVVELRRLPRRPSDREANAVTRPVVPWGRFQTKDCYR